jgi:hypothetical protein
MGPSLAENRMQAALGESGRDGRLKLERRPQEKPPDRDAALVEIPGASGIGTFGREAHGHQAAAAVSKLRGDDGSVAGKRAIVLAYFLVDEHGESIERLQVVVEIDLSAQDVGQCQGEINRFAGGIHRAKERRRLAGN